MVYSFQIIVCFLGSLPLTLDRMTTKLKSNKIPLYWNYDSQRKSKRHEYKHNPKLDSGPKPEPEPEPRVGSHQSDSEDHSLCIIDPLCLYISGNTCRRKQRKRCTYYWGAQVVEYNKKRNQGVVKYTSQVLNIIRFKTFKSFAGILDFCRRFLHKILPCVKVCHLSKRDPHMRFIYFQRLFNFNLCSYDKSLLEKIIQLHEH